jgi:hypothetical protein
MATAPRLGAELLDPEIERSKVYNPLKPSKSQDVAIKMNDPETRNKGDAIRRFELERAYGFGRRRKTRKSRRKVRRTRKYRK